MQQGFIRAAALHKQRFPFLILHPVEAVKGHAARGQAKLQHLAARPPGFQGQDFAIPPDHVEALAVAADVRLHTQHLRVGRGADMQRQGENTVADAGVHGLGQEQTAVAALREGLHHGLLPDGLRLRGTILQEIANAVPAGGQGGACGQHKGKAQRQRGGKAALCGPCFGLGQVQHLPVQAGCFREAGKPGLQGGADILFSDGFHDGSSPSNEIRRRLRALCRRDTTVCWGIPRAAAVSLVVMP